jgi:Fe-S cluster assembly ATP-binding protein
MLKIEHLSVSVDNREILRDINLTIPSGEVHVLLGPNGTGKSTLISTIMGFDRYKVTSGKIIFDDQDITHMPVFDRAKLGIGVMIQRPPTIKGLTLRQMVNICGHNILATENMAKWMGLDKFLDRYVNEGFSGGEIKRSELLQLLAQEPKLLLLDEPESGVDVENIALVGRAANYILSGAGSRKCEGKECGKLAACCGKACPFDNINPLAESNRSGLIITHIGHILKYVPAQVGYIMYNGTIAASGEPTEMLARITKDGYEKVIEEEGCGRI